MPVDNLSSLLSTLETLIDSDIWAVIGPNKFNAKTESNKVFYKLKEQALSLKQEIKQSAINQANTLNSQQSLAEFISLLPIAIAMFDRDICYLAASDHWIEDYQLEKSLVGVSLQNSFPELPKNWRQKYQECLEGRI